MRTLILCSCATMILALLPGCAVSVAPFDGGCYPPVARIPVLPPGGFCQPPAPAFFGGGFGCSPPPLLWRRPVITHGGFCPPVRPFCPRPPLRRCF